MNVTFRHLFVITHAQMLIYSTYFFLATKIIIIIHNAKRLSKALCAFNTFIQQKNTFNTNATYTIHMQPKNVYDRDVDT